MLRSPLTSRLSRTDAGLVLLIGLGLSLLCALLGAAQFAPIARLDKLMLDSFLRASASQEPAKKTVVIDIDEVSLSAVGQWPWPRYRVAALLARIQAEQPAAIALDILLPEPDRSSLVNIQQNFKRDFDLDIAFSGVPGGLSDNDGFLGHEIARGGVVASHYFYFDHTSTSEAPLRTGFAFDGDAGSLKVDEATGVLVNAAPIAQQTRFSGFVNSRLDDDGVLRRLPLLMRHEGRLHPNLALAAVMRSMGVSQGTIETDDDGASLRIGERRVPMDAAGSTMLRFNGDPSRYDALSAVDVIEGRYRGADLRGKIVFIGTSAVGLNDRHNTAVDRSFPGLKIQSVLAENILAQRFVSVPAWAAPASFAACLLLGTLVTAMVIGVRSIFAMLGASVLMCAGALGASAAVFAGSGRFVSMAAPLLLVATLFVVFAVIAVALEKRSVWAARKQLENARQVTIEAMASVAETRDPETGAHIKRTQHYVKAIAEELRASGHYLETLTPAYIELLFISAPLHDIGKVGVPDHILLKPGRLTPAEMELMKLHADLGRQIIGGTAARIDGDNFLTIAGEIAATHHEKWDGSGYPRGLAGQAIPLAGRIMAIADIYDALISRRCYKEPFPHEVATSLLQENRGKAFDPAVLDAFFRIEATIQAIAERYKDETEVAASPADLTARLMNSNAVSNDGAAAPTRVTAAMARDRAL